MSGVLADERKDMGHHTSRQPVCRCHQSVSFTCNFRCKRMRLFLSQVDLTCTRKSKTIIFLANPVKEILHILRRRIKEVILFSKRVILFSEYTKRNLDHFNIQFLFQER